MAVDNMRDFQALEPFFRVIEEGLEGLADGGHFFDLRVHRSDDSTVTLEYASEGKVTATGRPYGNRYISVVTIKDRKIIHWRDYLDPLRVFAALEDANTTDA